MDDEYNDEIGDVDFNRVVALYDFDPASIDWPFKRQQPLPLQTGMMVEVVQDDGSLWVFGFIVGNEEQRGYFPKNYTVSVSEYREMMRAYQDEKDEVRREPADVQFSPIPQGPLPAPSTEPRRKDGYGTGTTTLDDDAFDMGGIPGLVEYPALEPQPPIATTYELTKSRLLAEMPPVPEFQEEEETEAGDEIEYARNEFETELRDAEDPNRIYGGKLTESRMSTPATYQMTRPEYDFVRNHTGMEIQAGRMQDLDSLKHLTATGGVYLDPEEESPFPADMRVRATSFRMAQYIEPQHMRMALSNAKNVGARWMQMFRPGYRDIVNESFKVGCNACILSRHYIADDEAKMQFQRVYAQDIGGTLWFELQRRKEHLFYMRMDQIDVMMCHPTAWGFPDTNRTVNGGGNEPIDPFHGWFAQTALDTDQEMDTVEFLYTLRQRVFPARVFDALSLGRMPEWIQPYMTLHAKAEVEEKDHDSEDEEGAPTNHGKQIKADGDALLDAGLDDGEDLYVKLDELRLARERTVGPDCLELETTSYRLTGFSAMRIFLRSRGQPDNMKQALISPKMVKDMAAQLGILNDPSHFWYCMFALRYPLAHDWESVIRSDTRLYLHLPSDRLQPIHPMIKKFREHLEDCSQNEFLWDFRGFVKMKCSECGIPESCLWCQQCTDYFCPSCYLDSHKSARGRKHFPMPIPGSRYLTQSESARLAPMVPLLNVGFSNRRRFLAPDNQSDKMGSRSGDTWLQFDADTFQSALNQAPSAKDNPGKHWYLKRLMPPRLAPNSKEYYYNFEDDVIADDASKILTSTQERTAISLLQRFMKGALQRRKIKREINAALVIQKSKKMWDCQKEHGGFKQNAAILKSWYRKFRAKGDREIVEDRFSKVEATFLGHVVRKDFAEKMAVTTRFQASFRGLRWRRKLDRLRKATIVIQRYYRGLHWARNPNRDKAHKAAKIQAMVRGFFYRKHLKRRSDAATHIASHIRGMLGRLRVRLMKESGQKIQNNWRRFQAQLDVKMLLYEKLEGLRKKREDIMHEKLQDRCAAIFQRTYRRHRDYQKMNHMKREKGEAEKRTSTMLVALFSAAAQIRHFVHPWWRHLPIEIQEVLTQVKAAMQRTIALVPVCGKLASEEIGKRGLRTAKAEMLHYDQCMGSSGCDPDLASHMLLSVTRHLLSHVPAELFAPTITWACHAIGHQAVALSRVKGTFPRDIIEVGKKMPPHPGDTLNTMWHDLEQIKNRHDHLLELPNECLPTLILHKLPTQQRHVFLTAETLITMRQALDTPLISTDDHLKFQGLDASAGAQLMEVLGSELDHELPLDWPKTYGTVASLSQALSTHVQELVPEGKLERHPKKKGKAAAKATPKESAEESKEPTSPAEPSPRPKEKAKAKGKAKGKVAKDLLVGKTPPPEPCLLSSFNRASMLRVLQQVGYFMRDQHKLIASVLAQGADDQVGNKVGVRQSRYISVADKLFDMADRAKHDHCSFVLAVVLYHIVLRGIFLRVLYHRAAMALQKRYRYLKGKGNKASMTGPVIRIQRCWRGLSDSLKVMKMDDAAYKIQQSYKAFCWNRRSKNLMHSCTLIQRIWQGSIQRAWLKDCGMAAVFIQKYFRGLLVRTVFGHKTGRELLKKIRGQANELMTKRPSMTEEAYTAKMAAFWGRVRNELHKCRVKNVEMRRMQLYSLRSSLRKASDKEKKLKALGSVQPARNSVFEPLASAARRKSREENEATKFPKNSRVMIQVLAEKKNLDRTMPQETTNIHPHAAAKRGQAAIIARRFAKKPPAESEKTAATKPIDETFFSKWADSQFLVKKGR
jgi:hypothetical protein